MNHDLQRRSSLGTQVVIGIIILGILVVLLSAVVDAFSGLAPGFDPPANPDAQIVESP